MLRRLVGAGLGAVLALAGCGGGGDGPASPSPPAPAPATTTETAPATPSGSPSATATDTHQMASALLLDSDMPPGWRTVPGDDDEDDDFGQDECPRLRALDETPDGGPQVETSFAKGRLGPFFSQAIASAPSVGAASAALEAYDKALAACPSFTTTDEDGVEMDVRIAPLRFPDLGDESLAYRMTVTFEDGSYVLDYVIARVRTYGVMLVGTSIRTTVGGGTITPAEMEALARKAVAKASDTLPG